MPRNNKQDELTIYFNTPDAGRRYIAKLFETVLRRHDYRQYINERLAGDFACTLAQHFEEMKAREAALQLLLNERDEQLTSLEQRRYAEQQAREAAECNAARYRWLRGRNLETIHQGGVFAGKTPENMVINGVDLDNAIDAAIEAALNLASEAESQSPAPGYAPSPQQ
ncbi:hypothetical protein MKS85_26770 [Pseudomonas sp. JL2]|uniref:hypothetical protein n=1 Tax=Pseudomonas sp. JL2 TaxID=2919942 RepID=UPI0028642469|nr:hypothetical protein [Pseudomonas sp. JL2]MDR8389118.1 hypothetical protein [Pseudomonas sp. JL2]